MTTVSEPTAIYIVKRESSVLVTPDAAIVRAGDSTLTNWENATTGQTLVRGGYVVDSLSLTNVFLPVSTTYGETIQIYNKGFSNFSILQVAGQQIRLGDKTTTAGTSGSITSNAHGDLINLVFLNLWTSLYMQGNFTFT